MKKIILLILLTFITLTGHAQFFYEGFEGAPALPDATGVWNLPTSFATLSGTWLVKDNRPVSNQNFNWKLNNNAVFAANTGTGAAFVDRENLGAGVLSQDWLITPRINVAANTQLRFFTRQTLIGSPDPQTLYRVLASSSADQTDLSAFTTVLAEYDEATLSTLTADQLDYEEKSINLAFTGQRYIAFVKVYTQPTPATSGDRWLIDDVRTLERCIDPISPLGAINITTTSATITWTMPATSNQTQFEIEYGVSGFTQGTGTVVSATTPAAGLRSKTLTGLLPTTCYQFYVRSVCTASSSEWVGPFNFCTTPLGTSCAEPIVVTPLPYQHISDTGLYANNISATTPGNNCGGGAGFLGGNDVVYSYTVPATTTGVISIAMDPHGQNNTGVFVYANCAAIGNNCIAGVGNNNGSIRNIPVLTVSPGDIIYIVVSSTAAVGSFDYEILIQDVNCAPPTNLTAAGVNPTTATIGWQNPGGATNWQYYVQPAGTGIPTVDGVPTTTNSGINVTSLTATGDPLVVGVNNYQYWVRADCGDGTWSAWSGPLLFNTTTCPTGGCNYTFVMTDSFGDGWNGASMNIVQNNVTVASIGSTFTAGTGPIPITVPLCNGPFSLVWTTAGTFPAEVGVSIVNTFGQTIFAKPSGTGSAGTTPIFSGTVDCSTPACLAPTNLTVSNITTYGAKLEWSPNGPDPLSWDIYIVTTGSPAPTAASTPSLNTTSNPVVITQGMLTPADLLPNTAYTYYVRAHCTATSTSTWTAASPSFTTLPTCPQPTGLVLSNFDLNSMTLDWVNGGTEGNWAYIVQLAGDPAPTVTTDGWNFTTSHPVDINFLPPGTAFDFYVRAICDLGVDESAISGPVTGNTTICAAAEQCAYTFTLNDSFGDGWNGATMQVRQNDIVVATLGADFTDGTGPIVVTVPLCTGVPFDLFWNTAGTFPGEVRVSVQNSFEQTLFAITAASGQLANTVLYTATADCEHPACLPPATLTATNVSAHGADLAWVQNGTATPASWEIFAVPAGSPVPTPGTGIVVSSTLAPPYAITGLLADTDYVFYVSAICDGSSTPQSPLSVPSDIFHTLPTCPKPITLLVSNPDMNSLTFSWQPGAVETAWEYIYLPAGSPAPTAATTGWIPSSTTSVVVTGLTSATAYDFYVRGICTPVTDISTVSGPATGNTTICPAAGQCLYTFTLTDSFGDGWNGARMQVRQNGIVVATLGETFTGGTGPIVITVPICPGVPLDLFWSTAGNFPAEVRVSVSNMFQQTLYSMTASSPTLVGTVLYSNAAPSCTVPECQTPINLAANPFTYNAALTWNFIPGVTYEVYVVPQGSPAPGAGTTPTYSNVTTNPFFTAPQGDPLALTPLTNYTFYVRMVCPASTTPWSPGVNFTTLPTCPRPQNVTIVATTTTDATISFTEVGTATSWEVWVLPSGSPIPTPGDVNGHVISPTPVGGVITINTLTDLGMTGIFPGSYDFYVHSLCSPTDASLLTQAEDFYILNVDPVCASVTPSNPEIDADGIINLCPGESCVDLTATFTDNKQTTSYVVESIPFAPPFPFDGGTTLNIGIDDIWGPVFPLPFPFCFFGTEYPNVQVGSNGVLSFGSNFPPNVGGGCPWNTDPAVTVPNTAFQIKNAIYGVYQDLDPSEPTTLARSINYQVLGTAPCRTFVLNFVNIGQFLCGEDVGLQTSQIVLYETSNNIEVYVKDRTSCTTWNDGLGVIGIQNAAGTVGYVPPGRNLGAWDAHNEAWQFKPDGASNVVFSWLKDGEFYSNNTDINVCVSETTNMTAQAVYSGCGGVVTTKTSDVLLKVNQIDVAPIDNVTTCLCYALPPLTVGHYYPQTGGQGTEIPAGTLICENQTVYVYAELVTPNQTCSDEESFTVTVAPVVAPELPDVSACTEYTLPDLNNTNFNYYTESDGNGAMYPGTGGTVINTVGATTIYIFGNVGDCTVESDFVVTIGAIDAFEQPDITSCTPPVVLPALPANNTYYTQPGGPTGTGTIITDYNILTSQTIYIYAELGECHDESQFDVLIQDQFTPTFPAIGPLCVGDTAQLPAVSDNGIGGTWNPAVIATDTTGTTVYTFTPAAEFPCAVVTTLSITVNAPATPTFNPVSDLCLNAIAPSLPAASIEGVTGTWSPAVIDVTTLGATCYTFTPDASQHCYTPATLCVNVTGQVVPTFTQIGNICQNTAAPLLPTTSDNVIVGSWNPSAINTSVAGTVVYTFTPDTTLSACAIPVTMSITVDPAVLPTFNSIPDLCLNSTAPVLPTTSINLVQGTWSGAIDTTVAGSTTFTFTPDPGQPCALTTTITVNVITPQSPDFANITLCSGDAAPALSGTSLNGITGSWSPAVIDNTQTATYTFTPNVTCASPQTITVTVNTRLTPDFAAIPAFCSGNAPALAATSPNGITGTWSPATITQSGNYVFTPNAGQCATTQILAITVNPTVTPNFAEIGTICPGTVIPALANSSPNGITGTWSPATVSNTENGCYVFTPDAGQCANPQTLCVTIVTFPTIEFELGCVSGSYLVSVKNPIEGAGYTWEHNNTAIANATTPAINLTQLGTGTGTYTVNVHIGACDTDQDIVILSTSCNIQKGISPKGISGGDGLNDSFDLAGQNVKKLEIFNRYGTKVYSKVNYSNEWFGQSDKGDELPDGTYFYVIEYNAGGQSKTGWIYINREQ